MSSSFISPSMSFHPSTTAFNTMHYKQRSPQLLTSYHRQFPADELSTMNVDDFQLHYNYGNGDFNESRRDSQQPQIYQHHPLHALYPVPALADQYELNLRITDPSPVAHEYPRHQLHHAPPRPRSQTRPNGWPPYSNDLGGASTNTFSTSMSVPTYLSGDVNLPPSHLDTRISPSNHYHDATSPVYATQRLASPAGQGSFGQSSLPQVHQQQMNSVSSFNGAPLLSSTDPTTGMVYRTPEHPRLRTAQACEKCRTRKAKCSGEHPSCKRCVTRGLICQYAKEGRVRGPNKPKNRVIQIGAVETAESQQKNERRKSASSATGSSTTDSSYVAPNRSHISHRKTLPSRLSPPLSQQSKRHSMPESLSLSVMPTPVSQQMSFPTLDSQGSRRNSLSLGTHRSSRPRPPDLQLQNMSNHFRLGDSLDGSGQNSPAMLGPETSPGGVQQFGSMPGVSVNFHSHSPYGAGMNVDDDITPHQGYPARMVSISTESYGSMSPRGEEDMQSYAPLGIHSREVSLQSLHSSSDSSGTHSNPHSAASMSFPSGTPARSPTRHGSSSSIDSMAHGNTSVFDGHHGQQVQFQGWQEHHDGHAQDGSDLQFAMHGSMDLSLSTMGGSTH